MKKNVFIHIKEIYMNRKVILYKEDIENLICKEKLGKYEAAARLGTTFSTLQKYIEEYGIEVPRLYDEGEVVSLYNGGMPTAKIAKKYGVTSGTIVRCLKRNGVELSKRNGTTFKKGLVPWNKTDIDDDSVEVLKKLYNECKPVSFIAEAINTTQGAVRRKVAELNLIRPRSMKSRELYNDSNDEKIVEMYKGGMSSTEIGKKIGIGHRTVLAHLEHCGVKRRTLSESQYNFSKKERPKDFDSYEKMYDLYIVNRMSKKDIAETYNTDGGTIDRVLKKLGIAVRGSSEAKIGLCTGDKHPNWKGGRTSLYMRLREYFRLDQAKKVLKRDNNTCQYPGCGCKKKLQVHHIKPFKDIFEEILSEHSNLNVENDKEELYSIMRNDPRMNDLDNLITYCKECHLFKVHGYKKNGKPFNS